MLEKNLNHDLVSLFSKHGWSWKIPDPDQRAIQSGGKRPFDGVAYFKELGAVYFESKLMKNKLQAFSFSRIEEHQFDNLLTLRALGAATFIFLGFWVPRRDYYFFVFDPLFLYQQKDHRHSLTAKDLRWYLSRDFAIDLRHTENFTPQLLSQKCIKFLPEIRDDRK